MAKAPITEIFSTLKSYAQKLSDGERTPAEIASALNDWAHESADSVRAKIHEEVESAVLKMGFVKREEFDALAKEVAQLKKKSSVKQSATRSGKESVTKKVVKKAPVKRTSSKKAAR